MERSIPSDGAGLPLQQNHTNACAMSLTALNDPKATTVTLSLSGRSIVERWWRFLSLGLTTCDPESYVAWRLGDNSIVATKCSWMYVSYIVTCASCLSDNEPQLSF